MNGQIVITVILLASVSMFLWGRWRHDMVAGGALLACVLSGLVPAENAFAGFGHPAVITVACVLVLSHGLQLTGAIDAITRRVLPARGGPVLGILAITILAALLSAFMNNVGALALLIPVALQLAARLEIPAGRVLMPLAFGSILGGTNTLVGTPPNLIVSGFREQAGLGAFAMFDFTPVGLSVTVIGVLFIGVIGWRLVPLRRQAETTGFDTGKYLTEVRVPDRSKAIGKTLRDVEQLLERSDAQIVGLVRGEVRVIAPYPRRVLRQGDILVIEADPESLAAALRSAGLKLEESVPASKEQPGSELPEIDVDGEEATAPSQESADEAHSSGDNGKSPPSQEVVLQELVAMPGSRLLGLSAADMELRTRYGINLLAYSRQGRRSISRLRSTPIQAGDVLLMQGVPEATAAFAADYGCVPLAARDINVPVKGQALTASAIMALAVMLTALGILPVAISFGMAVLAFMALKIVPLRSVYQSIDWSVIVLLATMLPVAGAMATTGAADVLAQWLMTSLAFGDPVVALALILIITMTLSDFMNNTATAAVMCPLALSSALQLGVNPDSFLMAVALGASCAFLTPIGHQNNTLILGPGGFRFGDYWRMGLPVELLVIGVSLPVLLATWPL